MIRFVLFAGWGGCILWFSLAPSPPLPQSGLLPWDKLFHAAAYGVLTLLGGMAFSLLSGTGRPVQRWLSAMIFAVMFGAIIEAAQGLFTASRTAESGDLLANAAGAAIVFVAALANEKSGRSSLRR